MKSNTESHVTWILKGLKILTALRIYLSIEPKFNKNNWNIGCMIHWLGILQLNRYIMADGIFRLDSSEEVDTIVQL